MSTYKDRIEEAVLRALMTAPNNMQEKTINSKPLTVFEVQQYKHIITALTSLIQELCSEVIGEDEIVDDNFQSKILPKKQGKNELRAEQRKKLKELLK